MAIRFQCKSCKAVQAANKRLLGRQIACPKCGQPVKLPSQEQIDAAKQAKTAQSNRDHKTGQERQPQPLTPQFVPAVKHTPLAATVVKPVAVAPKVIEEEDVERTPEKPPREVDDEMDMTPMVDVTFLLLIFFMITASFSVQKSIQRPAQKETQASSKPVEQKDDNPDIVTVQIDEFNAYNVVTSDWDRPVSSKQDLIGALNEAHGGDSSGNVPTKLKIEVHEDALHGTVIAALDAGREASFESFEVTTVEQFD